MWCKKPPSRSENIGSCTNHESAQNKSPRILPKCQNQWAALRTTSPQAFCQLPWARVDLRRWAGTCNFRKCFCFATGLLIFTVLKHLTNFVPVFYTMIGIKHVGTEFSAQVLLPSCNQEITSVSAACTLGSWQSWFPLRDDFVGAMALEHVLHVAAIGTP